MTGKRIQRVIALCLLVCLCLTLAACPQGEGGQPTETQKNTQEKVLHTVRLKTEGGMALDGVGIYIYTDDTQTELVWFAKTDAKGEITFTDVPGDSYVAVLNNVPKGYTVEPQYPLTGLVTDITLLTDMTGVDDLANITYALGDAVQDFTVTDPEGQEYTLSQLLLSKKAVVLNFFYNQCQPCRNEFPYLQAAYEEYSEDIAVIAMNPVNQEDEEIAQFRQELGLTFPVVKCDPNWEKAMNLTAYPTTVIIDRFGTIALIHRGSVTEEGVFEGAFAHFAAEDYTQSVVEDILELKKEPPGSNEDDPIEIGGVTSFQVTVEPGQLVYYHIYKVKNMYLQIRHPDAYIIYNGITYKAKNGGVGVTVTTPDTYTPTKVVIGNSGKEKQVFTATLSAAPGSIDNPYPLELGEFTTTVRAGNEQGVYYKYKAKEDGVFKVQCTASTPGVEYDYTLYNLNTYAQRTIREDGSQKDHSVTIKVSAGQTVQVIVSTLPDSAKTYPGGTFTAIASMGDSEEEEEDDENKTLTYAITATDENRKPLAGVYLYVDVEGKSTPMVTGENGVATTDLPAGTYDVVLAIPEGYTANTTRFKLTEARPNFSIKLDTYVVRMETYTVKVVDDAGSPVPGVLVSVGSQFAITDDAGVVTFQLEVGEYTAVIDVPEGYTADKTSYPFGDATSVTVTLTEDSVPTEPDDDQGDSGDSQDPTDPNSTDPTKPTEPEDDPNVTTAAYTVTVTDYSGKTKTGVVVQFLKDGTAVAVKAVNAKGVAKATLEKGDYTVALAFSGETLYYEETTAVLSASKTSLTVKVAGGVTGEQEELYVGMAYHVDVGGTYVKLQADAINYFLFTPTEQGVYKFTTSDPNAVISYWGGNTFFIADQTSSTDYSGNAFTRNVKEGNLGATFIIGITGAPDCILEITRLGDAILDDTDIVPQVWEGDQTPGSIYKVTGVGGKKLKYLDLTAATDTYKLVYNSADGFYHLNTADGPVLYMNLGPNAPYVSMYNMLGFTGFGGTSLNKTFHDENGKAIRREDYTACMVKYVECIDETYGVYPLNDDLIYMIQQGGDYKGWWNSENGNYLFADLPGLNPQIAWMFAVCYFG